MAKMNKQRILHRRVDLSTYDLDGKTIDELHEYLNEVCDANKDGHTDIECRLNISSCYDDVEISLYVTRLETDAEFAKRKERLRKANAKRSKTLAERKAVQEEKQKRLDAAREAEDYQLFLKLKERFGEEVK